MGVLGWVGRALCGGGAQLTSIPFKYAVYCTLMLVCVSILDQADKWALPTLQIAGLQCSSCTNGGEDPDFTDPCEEQCLDISDPQMGFLLGPAFSLTSVFASLPIGWLADRTRRVRILLVGMVIWSSATVASAFVSSFYQLAILRMILGVGTAAVNPTAFSLLSDYFSPKHRSIVMSSFQSTVYIGQDVGLLTGIISQYTSWRVAFLVLGLPGLLLAIPLYLTLWEPARGASERQIQADLEAKVERKERLKTSSWSNMFPLPDTPVLPVESDSIAPTPVVQAEQFYYEEDINFSLYSPWQKAKYILLAPVFQVLWISSAFRFMGGYALGSWVQVFYRRVFGLSPTTIALCLAVIVPVGGLTASYTGGVVADIWKKRLASGSVWVMSICSVFAVPFLVGMMFANTAPVSFAFLFGEYLFAEMWIGPSVAVIQVGNSQPLEANF